MRRGVVHLVIADCAGPGAPPMVLGAYSCEEEEGESALRAAQTHARCITGASVINVELSPRLPEAIVEDIFVDFDDVDEGITPVVAAEPENKKAPEGDSLGGSEAGRSSE